MIVSRLFGPPSEPQIPQGCGYVALRLFWGHAAGDWGNPIAVADHFAQAHPSQV
jgi:hypothetical protein